MTSKFNLDGIKMTNLALFWLKNLPCSSTYTSTNNNNNISLLINRKS